MHSLLKCFQPSLRQPPAGSAAAVEDAAEAGGGDDDRPLGCGWFDSSHELQQGLQVTEHGSFDQMVAEMPLAGWLELQLAHWRPVLHGKTLDALAH